MASKVNVYSYRTSFARYSLLSCSLVVLANAPAFGDRLTINPTLYLEQIVTDNVRVEAVDKEPDSITQIGIDFDLTAETRKTFLQAAGSAEYEKFVVAGDADNVGLDIGAQGRIDFIEDFLFFEANAVIADEFSDATTIPATNRASAGNRTRIATVDFGPSITADLGNFAELEVNARYGEVDFRDIFLDEAPANLTDNTAYYGSALLTSGDISTVFESEVRGDYYKQNDDLEIYNGLYSGFYQVFDGFSVLGRVGYEDIMDPGITDISGIIWSGGVRYIHDQTSFLVEYGNRYDDPYWNVSLQVGLTPFMTLTGVRTQSFESEQSRLIRSLGDLFEGEQEFPITTPIDPDLVNQDLVSSTFFATDTELNLLWVIDKSNQPDVTGDRQTIQLSGALNEREFPSLNENERVLAVEATYFEQFTTRFGLVATVTYEREKDGDTGFVEAESYSTDWEFQYQLSRDLSATATFAWQKIFLPDDGSIRENVLAFAIRKSF